MQLVPLNPAGTINNCRLEWNQNQGTFSIFFNEEAVAKDLSIIDNFKPLKYENLAKINQCDRSFTDLCLETEESSDVVAPKVTEMRDWSMAHKPSKAFEQQSVKEKISQLKAMKPYLDED